MKYYAKMLCNRLISSLSTSMELEEQMITRMKVWLYRLAMFYLASIVYRRLVVMSSLRR